MSGKITPENIFITGCYRSGTTLLEKLLHSHNNISISSQPFPVLYFYMKQKFYEKLGLKRRYPLGHLFLENSYSLSDFYSFLDEYMLSKSDISIIFEKLSNYGRGLWTPEILDYQQKVRPGTFLGVYNQLISFIDTIFPKENSIYLGSKEILCEEYIPYFLSKGIKCILIMRDPRDMICSLVFRKANKLTGERRPILYSIRLWRKSVAFAIAFEDHPDFEWLKYENLVKNPIEILNRVFDFLNLSRFSEKILEEEIRDQYGKIWKGNSSFQNHMGVSSSSAGRFEEEMPHEIVSYVENCCLPEMKFLDYELKYVKNISTRVIRDFREPYDIVHDKFPEGNNYTSDKCSEEIKRYERLKSSEVLNEEDEKKWFLFEKVYKSLRKVFQ